MENIEKEVQSVGNLKYTKKQKAELLANSIYTAGSSIILVMAMEEVSELIQVITSNQTSKTDYWHTLEEVVDVSIMYEYMKIIFEVGEKEIKKSKKRKSKKKDVLILEYINLLATVQQDMSKYIRRKNHSEQRCIEAMSLMKECIDFFISHYKLKKSDMQAVEFLKLQRLEERLLHGVTL